MASGSKTSVLSTEGKKYRSLKLQFTLFFVFFILSIYAVVGVTSLQQVVGITEAIGAQLGIPVVNEAADIINRDDFIRLSKTLDPEDPAYERMRLELLALKEESAAVYLYTMVPAEGDEWMYIVDGSATPDDEENFSALGDIEEMTDIKVMRRAVNTRSIQISSLDFASDYGWLVSVYSPIYNSNGETIGLIGADFRAQAIYDRLWTQIIRQLILSFAFAAVGLTVYLIMLNSVNKQNLRLVDLKEQAERASTELRIERDEIAAMKDNLSAGLFLMDDKYIIQPQYSRALEGILEMRDLQGKSFVELLMDSLKAREQESLKDYFDMIFKHAFDAAMLEDINPLSEFTYKSIDTGSVKSLKAAFTPIDSEGGKTIILCVIEDISKEKALQQQLDEEESRRGEEMRALFEVVHVEPHVFSDFIEDTEYEFERINNILKNKELSTGEAVIEIYQSMHAIKSNAVILGLSNFGEKVHKLESEIKEFQDQKEISMENMLHLAVKLETLMKERDRYRDMVERLRSFSSGGDTRRQDRHVLIETLNKACQKAAQDQKKKVALVVEDIDGTVMQQGPRRVIKEVLTQLVRNSVTHGIESPEEREKAGKKNEGCIKLFIKVENGLIHIALSDNGRGLDFDKIRQKALSLKLIPAEAKIERGDLIKLIFSPGFSTAGQADMHAGRGIGLNLVRDRIRELDGSIKVQTEPGKGTVFNLYIPMGASKGKK
jgi:two-component system chemotaxis sensor kinase CheA